MTKTHLILGGMPYYRSVAQAMLISAGNSAFINRTLLANRFAVGIGLISYPLYLWHWPLFSLVTLVDSGHPKLMWRIGLLLLSFILATLTFFLVEKPVRRAKLRLSSVAIALTLVMAAVAGVGYACFVNDGLLLRDDALPDNSKREIALNNVLLSGERYCDNLFPNWNRFDDNHCKLLKNSPPTIMLIGDSHAGHLFRD